MIKGKKLLILLFFILFSLISFSKMEFALMDEWVYGGITIHANTYNMDEHLQSYYEYQLATNQMWRIGYAEIRDNENWNCLLTQLNAVENKHYKYGMIEGAWGSYMVKGYFFGPGIEYALNTDWNVLLYGGAYIVTSPFGSENGRVNINPQYGNASLNKITYDVMPNLGVTYRYIFSGMEI